MRPKRAWKECTSVVLILTLLCLFLPTSPAMAGWVSTKAALQGPKARLVSALQREEIAQAFQQLGIDPLEAQRRVSGLTDAEAQQALDRLDSLPAGGDLLLSLAGLAVFVFVVLLITDILGFTDVFPFVKKTVR